MKRATKRTILGNFWNEDGVSMGEVLGTTSLFATLRWGAEEPEPPPPKKKPPKKNHTTSASPRRRIFTPPVEATA